MLIEINDLNDKKAGTFMNIPVKRLKEVGDIVAESLAQIWNEEIIKNKKFTVELKVADITPLHKKLVFCQNGYVVIEKAITHNTH